MRGDVGGGGVGRASCGWGSPREVDIGGEHVPGGADALDR